MRVADIHSGPEGYLILFGWVFAEQIGLPLPAAPALIAAGALAGAGAFNFVLLITVALIASVLADYLWYRAGIFRRETICRFLRRYADSQMMQNARRLLARFGRCSLVFAKFVPGLSLAAPPLSGMSGTSAAQFLLFDTIGSLAWASAFIGSGYFFGSAIASGSVSFSPRLFIWLCGSLILGYAIIRSVRCLWRKLRKPAPLPTISSTISRMHREDPAGLACVARLITGEASSEPAPVVEFDGLNEAGNPFFADWMALWSRKLLLARSLSKITIELKVSARRTKFAKYPHGSMQPPSPEWSREQLFDKPQLQRAVSAIDVFPRSALLLTHFERLSLEETAILLSASKELVIRGQTIGLTELSNNLAYQQGSTAACRVPPTPVLKELEPAI